jgi:hypothetical protein
MAPHTLSRDEYQINNGNVPHTYQNFDWGGDMKTPQRNPVQWGIDEELCRSFIVGAATAGTTTTTKT